MATSRVTKLVCFSLFRILLPLTLLAAAVVRFNGLSFMYLLCLLITPLLPYPVLGFMSGHTGRFLKAMIVLSALPVLTHIIFHITLVAIATDSQPYGSMFPNCSVNEMLVRQIGFQRLDGVPIVHGVRLILPDVVVLVVSIIVLVVSHILIKREGEQSDLPHSDPYKRRRRRLQSVLDFLGESLVTFLLAASGIMVPAVLSSVYFVLFIVLAVLWSCYQSLTRGFAHLRIFLLIYSGVHVLLLHLYQFQFFQDFVPADNLPARLVGMTGLVYTDCSQVFSIKFNPNARWMMYVNPGVILLLYWVLAFETRQWCTVKDLTPEELLEASIVTGMKKPHKKRKRTTNLERQVEGRKNMDEIPLTQWNATQQSTGSLVFSGSAYGEDDDDDDEERLVDDGENTNYNSLDPTMSGATQGTDPLPSVSCEPRDTRGPENAGERMKESKRSWFVSILMFIMKQSYVLMLIGMMAWSIVYHSWLTFVLLLGACILWMLPNSRRACLVTSPLVVLYAVCLLIAQYIFNMSLRELPERAGEITVKEIGLQRFDTPPKDLALHIFFTLFFFMTLRQFIRERRTAADLSSDHHAELQLEAAGGTTTSGEGLSDFLKLPDSVDGYDGYTIRLLGRFFMEVMCKYWIIVCAGMLLLISVQEIVIYRIIYMILFLLFVLCFQVSYALWRLLMFVFWWVVILYSMVVLITIYTFQFEQFPTYWMNSTGWDNQTLIDIGLEKFSGTELFVKLLTPTSFLIVIILQVHYFHKPFLHLSALDRYKQDGELDHSRSYRGWIERGKAGTSDTEVEEDKPRTSQVKSLGSWVRHIIMFRVLMRVIDFWETLTRFLWRVAEIHIFKVVVIVITIVSTRPPEVSAVTAVYMILVGLLLPFVLTKAHLLLSHLAVFWTCLIILAKMMFQLRMVPQDGLLTSCPNKTNTSTTPLPLRSLDNSVWLGFQKIDPLGVDIDYYIRLYILILVVLVFESIVRYHQVQHFNRPDIEKTGDGIIFKDIHREDADKGLLSCAKFFANYAFYKFGLEICYIASAVTVAVRMDVFAVLYAILLGIMMLFSRRASSRVWWLYMIVLAVFLPVQFVVSLGFPPVVCVAYPWELDKLFQLELELWLYLPDMLHNPPTFVLMADVVQLLLVCMQWKVFRLEIAAQGADSGGGSNEEILPEVEANTKIPVEDFTVDTSSYMDVIKQGVFEYMFWVTLAIIFIAGATRINIFGMGYVIAVFCFMWYGKEFLLKPLRKLLRMWNYLIAYVVFVLFMKACLQLVGCVYITSMLKNTCWVIQLLGINCHMPLQEDIIKMASDRGCMIEPDNTGLAWDVVCFTFLLFQRRIYSCHYFRHVVDLLHAQSRLSSRGAELINRILVREVSRQKEQEKHILVNIKKKMAALKEKQSQVLKDYKEPEEHFQAIRAGDYYLFEDVSVDMVIDDGSEPPVDSVTFGTTSYPDEQKRPGPLQVISTAVEQGTNAAVEMVKSQDDPDGKKKTTALASSQGAKPDITEETEQEESGEDPEAVSKAKKIGNFITAVIASTADWIIQLCNRISRNYRLVAQKLDQELKLEKEKIQAEKQLVTTQEMDPSFSLEKDERLGGSSDVDPLSDLVEVSVAPAYTLSVVASRSLLSLDQLEARADDCEKEFEASQPRAYRLLVALVYVLISHSELLCYFLMILNQMVYGSLLSLPLPFMVFLWGMLSVPRPSKTFWITVITYTEAVVVTKYLFQFGFFPWNDGTVQESPFYPPRILGIEQRANYANVDIALLLALFIHRSILKRYGLWRDSKDISDDLARAGEKERSRPASPEMRASIEMGESDELKESGSSEGEKEPSKLKKSIRVLIAPFTQFFAHVSGSSYNATVDVYAPMFCCDFINFFIIVFGYQSFGPALQSGDGDVASYITENRIPVPFLVMLIVQFVFIIVDRALFLRKNVLGKFIFQIFLVILIHIWMFFVLPDVTGRSFFNNVPAQLYYFVKCVYFALSAYQIRCGYPTRILGNFLTKKYNYINLFLFKGFLAIPFLLELRALMDWIWTDSTLAIGSWLQMEDIYANIFCLKCWRHAEEAYPTPRATKKPPLIKYSVGGLLLFIIILIIWFPLVIFAFANEVFEPNPPTEVTVQMRLGGYQPLFKTTVQQDIRGITPIEYASLKDYFSRDTNAMSFLNRFDPTDVSVITFDGQSTSIWGISPPAEEEMINVLSKGTKLTLEFSINILRNSDGAESSGTSDTLVTYFLAKVPDTKTLADIINGTAPNTTVKVNDVFPRFIQLTAKNIRTANSLLQGTGKFGKTNLTLGLAGDLRSLNQYWSVEQEEYGGSPFNLAKTPSTAAYSSKIVIITFNDRKAPSTLSFLTGYGIIGLYVSVILLIGRIIRLSTTSQFLTIMFRELPQVDNFLQLCLDIYLVREMKEFHLEEDLYAKLIFCYRSPETIVKWTRPKPKTD